MSILGLGYHHQHHFVALPLLRVQTHATVKELGAQVRLVQTSGNEAKNPFEAVYVFPVPARAVLSSFVMVKRTALGLWVSYKRRWRQRRPMPLLWRQAKLHR